MAETTFSVKALMMLHGALVFTKQVFIFVFCIPEALSCSLTTLCMSAAHILKHVHHNSLRKQLEGHTVLPQCYLHVSHVFGRLFLMTFILYLGGF